MGWIKDVVVSLGLSAAIAALLSYGMSKPESFMPWFAFALACSLGNGLIMTPTAAYRAEQAETTHQIFSGHTIHPPRMSRFKDPRMIGILAALAGVLSWMFIGGTQA